MHGYAMLYLQLLSQGFELVERAGHDDEIPAFLCMDTSQLQPYASRGTCNQSGCESHGFSLFLLD
ncbi:hypothetical protein P353_16865 [Comamonas testosteroni]|uniref:Uncharacterized protein n=1 Tax=Comamonas testosteroni TaxID=285 RepID=A0A096FDT0_COMTE|nr:hypothetical protein P353_16865 [Comamonas testosteroni]